MRISVFLLVCQAIAIFVLSCRVAEVSGRCNCWKIMGKAQRSSLISREKANREERKVGRFVTVPCRTSKPRQSQWSPNKAFEKTPSPPEDVRTQKFGTIVCPALLDLRAEKTMTATDVTGFDAIFSTGFFATFSRF